MQASLVMLRFCSETLGSNAPGCPQCPPQQRQLVAAKADLECAELEAHVRKNDSPAPPSAPSCHSVWGIKKVSDADERIMLMISPPSLPQVQRAETRRAAVLTRVQEPQAKYDKKLKKKGLAAKNPGSSEPSKPKHFTYPPGCCKACVQYERMLSREIKKVSEKHAH